MQLEPNQWVEQYGNALYKYAILRLRDRENAENVVQETFVAALDSKDSFKGKSSPLTWLTGILKYKIIDYIRKEQKERFLSEEKFDDVTFENLFDNKGKWKTPPAVWKLDPSELMEKVEFWTIFKKCLDAIPSHLAHIFTLKELEDMESKEICKLLGMTPTNLWVKLHRTREKLRNCLTANWFGKKDRR